MTPKETENIEKQIKQLEDSIQADEVARGGLIDKIAKAQKDEDFNKSQFQKYHNILFYYELEVEGMSGEKIAKPISESDVSDLADNGGRLYKGIDGTDAKIIPELVGGGLFSGRVPFELDRRYYIDTLIQILRSGTGESQYSDLVDNYVAGSGTVELENQVGSDIWVFLGQSCLIKIGQPTPVTSGGGGVGGGGSSTTTYSYPVIDFLQDTDSSEGVVPFNGFSNSQRTSKNGGSLQGIMNTLEDLMGSEVGGWYEVLVNKTKRACDMNTDDNFDTNARIESFNTFTYLTFYLDSVPLEDGVNGLDGLIAKMDSRQGYINGTRIDEISVAKKFFYSLRINFINLRADIQDGSLTRVRYMSKLMEEIPPGGSAQQKKAIQVLKALLV